MNGLLLACTQKTSRTTSATTNAAIAGMPGRRYHPGARRRRGQSILQYVGKPLGKVVYGSGFTPNGWAAKNFQATGSSPGARVLKKARWLPPSLQSIEKPPAVLIAISHAA